MKGIQIKRVLNENEHKNIKHIICEICTELPVDPVTCQECEETFCSNCIQESLQTNPKCPKCNSEFKKNKPHKSIMKLLGDLVIACAYRNNGCKESLKMNSLKTHEDLCEFRDIECQACKKIFLKSQYDDHYNNCAEVGYTCQDCGYSCKKVDLKMNHSCFKYFEQTMKYAVAQQLALIRTENDNRINELRSYFDFLKSEVSRVEDEVKDLRMKFHLSSNQKESSKNGFEVLLTQKTIEREMNELNRSLNNINLDDLNKSGLDSEFFNPSGFTKDEVEDNKSILSGIKTDLSRSISPSAAKRSSGVYFPQEINEHEIDIYEKRASTLNTGLFNSLIKQKSLSLLENLGLLEKESFVPSDLDEMIKTLAYIENTENDELPSGCIITGHNSGTLLLWDANTMKLHKSHKEHNNSIWDIKVLPQLKGSFMTAGLDRLIKIWDTKSNKSLKTIEADFPVYCIEPLTQFNPYYLATGGSNKNLIIWDIKNKQKVMSREIERKYDIEKLVFLNKVTRNGKTNLLLCVNYNIIRLINLNTLDKEREYRGHEDWINSVVHLSEEKFASASQDGTIRFWSLSHGTCMKVYDLGCTINIAALLSFDNGSILISGSNDKSVKVLKVDLNSQNESEQVTVIRTFTLSNEIDQFRLVNNGSKLMLVSIAKLGKGMNILGE